MNMFEFIVELVALLLFVAPFMGLLFFLFYVTIRTDMLRKDYRKTLNEHDKRVLDDYFYVDWFTYRKFKKNPKLDINFDKTVGE